MTKPTVFISYSHKDEDWKDRLVTHLGVLQQEGLLDLWDDRRIGAGEDWYQKIEEAIAKARATVLLVSADFLTSNFIMSKEVPRLLERKDKEGLRIFPVIIRPCAWKHVKWLARMNLRPRDGEPISSGDEHQIDADLAAIVDEVAAIIESKNPKTPLETSPTTTPEKISIPQLQSTDFDLYGHEMKPEIPHPKMLRIQHLADNIQKDLDLLKEYEDVLRLEDDPRRRARCRREIEQLRESAASYKTEYDELQIQITGKPTVAMQNVGAQLNQMDAKLSTLLVGQIKIQDTLVNLRRTVLARFDANEQTIITTIVDRLDQEQLIDTQDVLDSIATRQFAENLQETLLAVSDTLNEIRQKEAFLEDSHLTREIEKLSNVVGAPTLDVSHKLKITVPIIPFILSYEGELTLKSGMNLESAWHRLLSKVRR
jgi:hypothetical protein